MLLLAWVVYPYTKEHMHKVCQNVHYARTAVWQLADWRITVIPPHTQ